MAIAIGNLLPQAQAQGTGTAIRKETAAASLGQQPERETKGQLGISLPIISDQEWANLTIEKQKQVGRVADRRDTELDAVYQATSAYLNVLRSKALATVDRENVRITRSNFELAKLREQTGTSSRADVYRWDAELAKGRRRVLDADASLQIAALNFNRILNRPLEEAFQTQDATMLDPAGPRAIRCPAGWRHHSLEALSLMFAASDISTAAGGTRSSRIPREIGSERMDRRPGRNMP